MATSNGSVNLDYPLVNVDRTVENHLFLKAKSHCSFGHCQKLTVNVYQRVRGSKIAGKFTIYGKSMGKYVTFFGGHLPSKSWTKNDQNVFVHVCPEWKVDFDAMANSGCLIFLSLLKRIFFWLKRVETPYVAGCVMLNIQCFALNSQFLLMKSHFSLGLRSRCYSDLSQKDAWCLDVRSSDQLVSIQSISIEHYQPSLFTSFSSYSIIHKP